jgi:predicted nuclease of predicted toxin-antitoxin system
VPEAFSLLLDQNVPRAVAAWLRSERSSWTVWHAAEQGLGGKPDEELFAWAQDRRAILLTFDEDFADRRTFPVGSHWGVIRLRVWPTTVEEVQSALARLFSEAKEEDLRGALVIVGRSRIRIRPGRPPSS